MKASIDLTAVADQLANCKPGDEYSLVFVVDQKTNSQLTGTASDIEHLGEEDYDEEESPEEMPHGPAGRKKLPKAILMIAK